MHKVTFILLIIGGLNWLLAAFNWDIATWGIPSNIMMIIYVLIGLSAIYEIATHKKNCLCCQGKGMQSGAPKMGM